MIVEREDLLAAYGRFYGEQHLAVTFTAATAGDGAKRVTAKGWDKTLPLADGDFGAALVSGRGAERNPAIVLRPSNLIVIECDSEQDLVSIQQLDLPETITVRSSKPYKRHYWFRPPPELDALPFVAFRFESGKLTADSGRYFLAPPSLHPSGAVYAFLPEHGPHEREIATLPQRIYDELIKRARAETRELREHIENGAKIPHGNQHYELVSLAGVMRRRGMTVDEIYAALLVVNRTRCEIPGPEQNIRQIAESVGTYAPAEAPQTPEQIEPAEDPWKPINLAGLPEVPPVKPTLGQVGLVYPGKRHVFSGPQESAKTLAAYAIGLQVVRDGGTVILIDFEMGSYDARNRLRELGATSDELARFPYLEPWAPAREDTMEKLLAHQPTLVIVDAAAGAFDLQGLDDNKRQDVERFTRLYVRTFWRNGVATIVLDHVVKDREARGKYAVGSERKVGGADVHIGFEVMIPISRGGSGLYKIITHKDRGGFLKRGTLAHMRLQSDPDTHNITWGFEQPDEAAEDGEFEYTIYMERISKVLETHPDGLSKTAVKELVTGNASYIFKAIDALIRKDHVHAEKKGQTHLLTLKTPYSKPPIPTHSEPVPESGPLTHSSGSPPYGGTDGAAGTKTGAAVPEQLGLETIAGEPEQAGEENDGNGY